MTIFFISLGCDKNLVDSEAMLGTLAKRGYAFTDDPEAADIAVINTCCFINDAKEESIRSILETAELKTSGRLRALIVTGCLAERYREEIQKEIPEVDAIVGTAAIEKIADVVEDVLAGNRCGFFADLNTPQGAHKDGRIVTTAGGYAYLKIAEGCDKRCTYCIIPHIRGSYRSVPMEALLAEAETLAKTGVRELILVAQETTLYGVDLYGKKSLPELLHGLCRIEGLQWIRLLYCYPEEITDELIAAIRSEEKICHYLDIPIQHASDPVLRRMGRRTTARHLREIIETLRGKIPDICLRTTLITGFPGETQEDFEALYRFVNEMEFERLGVFAYSAEEDTPAYSYPDQVPQEVKEERRDEIMELQQDIAFGHCEDMVGRVLTVLIEGKVVDEPVYVGRTYMDAPNVDGLIFVNAEMELMSGDFVRVKVTGAAEYDLIGEVYDESAQ